MSEPVLHQGDHGGAVEILQRALNAHGAAPPLVVDGIFGGKVFRAVEAFQKAKNLTVNGIVGVKTWQRLEVPVPGIVIVQRRLSFAGGLPARTPRHAMIFHTNAGGPDVYDYWEGQFRATGSRICSHFQIFKDGRIEQMVDTARQAFAAFDSNGWAIQVESEDDNRPTDPWTAAQLTAVIGLCKHFGIPGRILQESPSDGVGWHCLYQAWNQSNHSCPCPAKIAQIRTHVIPAL